MKTVSFTPLRPAAYQRIRRTAFSPEFPKAGTPDSRIIQSHARRSEIYQKDSKLRTLADLIRKKDSGTLWKSGPPPAAGNRQPCETHVRTGCGRAGAESRQPARPGSQMRYSKKHAGKDGGGRNMGKKNSSEKIRLPTVSLLLENQDSTTNQPLSKTAKAMVM